MDVAALTLVNSLSSDWVGRETRPRDRLDEPGWLEQYLARWGWGEAGLPDGAARERLLALRALLRRLVDTLAAGDAPAERDLAELNAVMAGGPTRREIVRAGDGYVLVTTPLARDWNWVLAEIAASFADLLAHGDPQRIKVCENEACSWAFYDESRSRTRRWCEDTCGNLVKVRRFRARQRAAARSASGTG